MFVSYNLDSFGGELKKLRKILGYSQSDVQEKVGVSVDTIRKIESGQVIPRYDTLECLSVAYKHDLLELLKKSRSNKLLMEYHDDIDYIITCFNKDELSRVKKELQDSFNCTDEILLLNPYELKQFMVFIEAIGHFHSNYCSDKVVAKQDLIDTLRLTIPRFNMKDFKKYNYNYIELRILLLISLLIAKENNFKLSNEILYYILNHLVLKTPKTKYIDFLVIKVYSNIAYNYHMLDDHHKVVELVNAGISFCLDKETIHVIHSLYYRKGIALFNLGKDGYLDSLKAACFILKITDKLDLLETYIKATKDKYGISLSDF